jgi:HSP20 family protein
MLNLWNAFDDVMPLWFTPYQTVSGRVNTWPAVDIEENDQAYLIAAELPGVKLDDIKLELENEWLSLSVEKRPEVQRESQGYYYNERRYGTFTRSFALPKAVNRDGVTATMKEGVLMIHVPKSEQARARQIPIQMGALAEGSPAPRQISS